MLESNHQHLSVMHYDCIKRNVGIRNTSETVLNKQITHGHDIDSSSTGLGQYNDLGSIVALILPLLGCFYVKPQELGQYDGQRGCVAGVLPRRFTCIMHCCTEQRFFKGNTEE